MSASDSRARLTPVSGPDGPREAPADSRGLIAEYAVLGTVIQSRAAANEALGLLLPEYFSRNANRAVFEAVSCLSGTGQDIDPPAVMSELSRTGTLPKIGAPGLGTAGAFLHSLMQRAGHVAYHAPVIIAAARQRALIAALESARHLAAEGFDPDETPDRIRKLIDDASGYAAPSPLHPNSEAVIRVLDALESSAEPGLPTGYPDLDTVTGGLQPEKLYVIAARPGHGKTLIAACMADHLATRIGHPVLFSSLEMTEDEITERRIAATAKVPLDRINRHEVTDPDWDRISKAKDRLLETMLFIDDASRQTLAHVRGRLTAMRRAGNPARLLVVDYLGFVQAPRAENRQQEVSAIARDTKALAREFGIPVILLAQLNRGPELRSDHIPVSADLRESGEVEQTADVVILLHRPDAYEQDCPRAGEIDLHITKNRQGPLTVVTLLFQGHYGRIVPLHREWTPYSAIGGAR